MDKIEIINKIYSYLGKQVLLGDVETIKYFYGNAWKESPPLIRTIGLLQECLTTVEIERDAEGVFCDEFLYYWAMICIGEQSNLIFRDLGTAEYCLKKIQGRVQKADVRLAFIGLLKSDEPYKSESNVRRLDLLRVWAGKQDLFSRVVLAKIVFYQFFMECQKDSESCNLPIKVWQLLEQPCQKGYPPAVRFFKEIVSTGLMEDINLDRFYSVNCSGTLFDF